MKSSKIKIYIWLALFSIAMAFLESSVVIYIRELYYPEGFNFPLKLMSNKIAITEFFRELATIIMLLTIAYITGKHRIERFAYFLFCFAIWDIFYYVFLWIVLSWPVSMLTWDVLFLIPGIWTGPVIAPIINSLSMILISLVLVYFFNKNKKIISLNVFLTLLISGAVIILISYLQNYYSFLSEKYSLFQIFTLNSEEIIQNSLNFIPVHFIPAS